MNKSGSNKSLKIGLTGGIGSGKTTVAKFFAAKSIHIVNVDVISRQIVAKGQPALKLIQERYGEQILKADQELNRSLLRKIIFKDSIEKQWLEDLLHPLIRSVTIQQLEYTSGAYCILESPLLFETQQNTIVDKVIVVDVPLEIQRQRAAQRDNIDIAEIDKIIASQIDRETRINRSTYVINNEGDLPSTSKQVDKLHDILSNLALQTK